ncbi:hypothetical protein HMPREF9237_00113 [Actinotignum schaalii FB123-CNA-2]|uniref:Uncharacterized protein n=1 Tax=Actinotignum schaalii FB123-CNA-2 TaxID=883067 RepID=S2VP40_9ACTO|nr:hypothetical protein HMPREF9237_00113 [Actinotignum schaalii FB123-CNA-2]
MADERVMQFDVRTSTQMGCKQRLKRDTSLSLLKEAIARKRDTVPTAAMPMQRFLTAMILICFQYMLSHKENIDD